MCGMHGAWAGMQAIMHVIMAMDSHVHMAYVLVYVHTNFSVHRPPYTLPSFYTQTCPLPPPLHIQASLSVANHLPVLPPPSLRAFPPLTPPGHSPPLGHCRPPFAGHGPVGWTI